jgi:DNA-binding response OmpR family regulator
MKVTNYPIDPTSDRARGHRQQELELPLREGAKLSGDRRPNADFMPLPAEKSRVVRFDVFEVNLQEAELRKSGIRIKLQEQPFQILAMLLERPGQTVTREELRHKLWPTDTFVDFDHSLNSSINKLREALGDNSENPRFI